MRKIISFPNAAGSLTFQATKREAWLLSFRDSRTVLQKGGNWVDESSAYKMDVTTVHCGCIMCAQRIKNSGVKRCGKSCKLNKPRSGAFFL